MSQSMIQTTAAELSAELDSDFENSRRWLSSQYRPVDFRHYSPDEWQIPQWLQPHYAIDDDNDLMLFVFPALDETALSLRFACYHAKAFEMYAKAAGCKRIRFQSGELKIPDYELKY